MADQQQQISEPASPEQSSLEIHSLIQKLDQSNSTHKDRVRRLTRFRNYVSAGPSTPEFYDDDIPLLLLGSAATPAGLYGINNNDLDDNVKTSTKTGLLQACGAPSQDHGDMLKRSARYAMSLLKYLVCDHRECINGRVVPLNKDPVTRQVELNMFAHSLCCCTVDQLSKMKLHWHVENDNDSSSRSGAKAEACAVLVLLLTRHLSPDGSSEQPIPLQDLLPTVKARKAFDMWLNSRNGPSKEVQKLIKTQQILTAKMQTESSASHDDGDSAGGQSVDGLSPRNKQHNQGDFGQEQNKREMVATRWSQSQLNTKSYKFTKTVSTYLLEKGMIEEEVDEAEQKRQEEEEEARKRSEETEKKRMLCRDPLGVYNEELDLLNYQQNLESVARKILEDFDRLLAEEEKLEEQNQDDVDAIYRKKAPANICSIKNRRKTFLAALTKGAKEENVTSKTSTANDLPPLNDVGSIMTTDADFKPMLFLSLVHINSKFDQLQSGLDILGGQTDNQVFRLQNLVRDNFALFLRCANGIDLFDDAQDRDTARYLIQELFQRFDKMDKLSNTCVRQANNSFTSLLENTTDVRKTQSALAVLERMRPILEVPTLMKNHLEAGRFTGAVNAYRRVLTIKEDCQVELLKQVKERATEIAQLAQRDLEQTLADPNVSVGTLLDAIRDLRELQSLSAVSKVSPSEDNDDPSLSGNGWKASKRALEIVRSNPPALACLLLQSKHFSNLVDKSIEKADNTVKLISERGKPDSTVDSISENDGKNENIATEDKNRWRYDILEARVSAAVQAVSVSRSWLPRLVRIGVAAHEAEKRVVEPPSKADRGGSVTGVLEPAFKAYDVYAQTVSPAVIRLVEHATFCSLGCGNSGSPTELNISMSFGKDTSEKLQALLRAPLPPALSAKCATELAGLVDVVYNFAISAGHFRRIHSGDAASSAVLAPSLGTGVAGNSLSGGNVDAPLVACVNTAENALITAERRRCIFAFDSCGRSCASLASSRGVFDVEALILCVKKLSEELTRPQQCANEIERGCQLVIRRCCEGLASYVRERGTSARLRVVSVCANAISGKMLDVVRDVSFLTGGQSEDVQELLSEDLESLERVLFDEFLESVNRNVTNSIKLGLVSGQGSSTESGVFPTYLSSSLLAITRCRAQVEKALGDTFRRSAGKTYQEIAVFSASESMVNGMCNEIISKAHRITASHADRLANELQFVVNTVQKHVDKKTTMQTSNSCLQALCKKAGRGNSSVPVDLSPIEELERLGRVYVLCLSDA